MVKHIGFVVLSVLLLLGCQQQKHDLPVYPVSLSTSPSLELGDAVRFLIPDEDETLFWDWKSNRKEIVWLDSGYKENKGIASRKGLMRINVLGVRSTVLLKTKHELAWSVDLTTSEGAKFGPKKLLLSPVLVPATVVSGRYLTVARSNHWIRLKKQDSALGRFAKLANSVAS